MLALNPQLAQNAASTQTLADTQILAANATAQNAAASAQNTICSRAFFSVFRIVFVMYFMFVLMLLMSLYFFDDSKLRAS